jgi:hypothetical protein
MGYHSLHSRRYLGGRARVGEAKGGGGDAKARKRERGKMRGARKK